jgi:membrane-associated phospholipid phosphatase
MKKDTRTEVKARLAANWRWKAAGIPAGTAVFFAAYFWLLENPRVPVQVMPVTATDRWVPFWPAMLPAYLSLWVYVSLAPGLAKDLRELRAIGLGALGLAVAGLGIFWVWPTAVPAGDIDWAGHGALRLLKGVDATGNACPSLHVAFAVWAAVWFARLLGEAGAGRRVHAVSAAWCAAIVVSTVAIRQHVVLDVAAGVLLGAAAGWINLRWTRKE